MLGQAEKSLAPNGLHVQIEPLAPALWITVPCESDPGSIGGEGRRSRLSGQSCKRNGRQGSLLLQDPAVGAIDTQLGLQAQSTAMANIPTPIFNQTLSEVDMLFDFAGTGESFSASCPVECGAILHGAIASSTAGAGKRCERWPRLQIHNHLPHGLVSLRRNLLQCLLNDVSVRLGDLFAQRRQFAVDDSLQYLQVRLAAKWPLAGEHFVEHDAE